MLHTLSIKHLRRSIDRRNVFLKNYNVKLFTHLNLCLSIQFIQKHFYTETWWRKHQAARLLGEMQPTWLSSRYFSKMNSQKHREFCNILNEWQENLRAVQISHPLKAFIDVAWDVQIKHTHTWEQKQSSVFTSRLVSSARLHTINPSFLTFWLSLFLVGFFTSENGHLKKRIYLEKLILKHSCLQRFHTHLICQLKMKLSQIVSSSYFKPVDDRLIFRCEMMNNNVPFI